MRNEYLEVHLHGDRDSIAATEHRLWIETLGNCQFVEDPRALRADVRLQERMIRTRHEWPHRALRACEWSIRSHHACKKPALRS